LVREQTEITAARRREVDPGDANGSQGDFEHAGKRREGRPGRARGSVQIVPYRVDAGAVLVALFEKDCVSPDAVPADRECWSAIAADEHAASILENSLAAAHIGAKGLGRQAIYPNMIGPVACQLVPVRYDAPDQSGVPFGNPAERKEGCLNLCFG